MPKIHVAYRTDVTGLRLASGSSTTLRKRIGQTPSSQWTIAQYDLPNNVQTLCQCIEDIAKISYQGDLEKVHVNESGRLRTVE